MEARQLGRVSLPLPERHFERLFVLLLIVIDDGQRQACFEIGERQAGALSRRVAITVSDRSTGRAISRGDHRIELA